jgi:hypothetical protein
MSEIGRRWPSLGVPERDMLFAAAIDLFETRARCR